MTEVEILEQYRVRSMSANWGSAAEMRWVSRRTAAILGWPVAPSAGLDNDTGTGTSNQHSK